MSEPKLIKVDNDTKDWIILNHRLSVQIRHIKKTFWDSHNKNYKVLLAAGDVFNISLYDYEYIVGHYDIPHKGIHDKKYIGGK